MCATTTVTTMEAYENAGGLCRWTSMDGRDEAFVLYAMQMRCSKRPTAPRPITSDVPFFFAHYSRFSSHRQRQTHCFQLLPSHREQRSEATQAVLNGQLPMFNILERVQSCRRRAVVKFSEKNSHRWSQSSSSRPRGLAPIVGDVSQPACFYNALLDAQSRSMRSSLSRY